MRRSRHVRSTAVALLLFAALTVGALEAMGFAATGMLGLAYALLLATSLGLVLQGTIQRRRAPAHHGLGLAIVLAASIGVSSLVQAAQVRESQRRGGRICTALEAHRQRTGAYPATLADLAPRDLEHVPTTAMGAVRTFEFVYQPVGPDDFDLRFAQPSWTGWRRGPAGLWARYD